VRNSVNENKSPSLEGLLLVDKAKGSSSFQVVSKVRRALGTRAVGHVGTLDPLASGLLVFLVGRFTRLSNCLMAGEKKYRAVIELGTATNTDDKEGQVVAQAGIDHLELTQIASVLTSFLGLQQQIPPMFSAISMNGVRSYKRARAGEVVEMAAREIEIVAIEFISYEAPILTIDVKCSKGTYIRSLARDIGARLGVPAHLADLRRTECSGFKIEDAVSEGELGKDAALALRKDLKVLRDIKQLEISEFDVTRLKHGLRVRLPDFAPSEVVLATHGDQPIAICRIENSELISVRGF
jgi:tRNA pseudouridine55 synthase